MSADKLSLEIAALEKQSGKAKNAVIKKVLLKKIDKLKVELEAITSVPVAKAKIQRAKTKISQMTPKEFADYIKKLSKDPKYSFLKGMSSDEIARDIKRTAKPVGWRFRGRENFKTPTKRDVKDNNNVYYENRRNRSDVSRSLRLETGGGVEDNKKYLIVLPKDKTYFDIVLKRAGIKTFKIEKHSFDYTYHFYDAKDRERAFGYLHTLFSKGGGIDINELNMPVIRTQFEDEDYEFEEGGEITANERMQSLKNYPKLKF